MKSRLNELGERRIINELRKRIPLCRNNLLGTEDDSAIYDAGLDKYLVISTDRIPFSYGIHYSIVNFYGFGRYFAGTVINDVIAKGAKPFAMLVSLGLPSGMRLRNLHLFYKGINNVIRRHKISIIGGDTKQTTTFDVVGTAIGLIGKTYFIPRNNASVGDIVAVTGPVGLFAGNLYAAMLGNSVPRRLVKRLRVAYNRNLRMPYETMNAIASLKSASASIDVSDGLFGDLNKVAKLSDVGIEINRNRIPFSSTVKELSNIMKVDLLRFATIGGDLQIALTITKEKWNMTLEKLERRNLRLYEIGKIIRGSGITICHNDKRKKMRVVPEWEWFTRTTAERLLLD